ncbi:GNAT family N-acetyltransferase [Halomonas sp. TBZ9]|uniref:GNAT family N-acetyltransferase n=1 Tax=Vreelandella azerica TaxID=2732867 RepID=A0A7Y3XAY3_9GAMM|nr:GNAT family N-acetyltransferase [Halomonas azerica]NOG31741.1 GNAT family N-acetyltransferase [Halomonas azerica]
MNNRQDVHDQVVECPEVMRRDALWSLAAAQNSAGQRALAAAIQAFTQTPAPDWSGLLYYAANYPTRAVWVQPFPGNMAQLWRPQREDAEAQALLQAARKWVEAHAIRLCHCVVMPNKPAQTAFLSAAGMQRVAPLRYLSASLNNRDARGSQLTLRPWNELAPTAAQSLIEQVQVESLDSPLICEALGSAELLQGFHRQSPEADRHWFAVYSSPHDPQPIGVLLMVPRQAQGVVEVLLMGLVPTRRGLGLGRELLQAAFDYTAQIGATRLALTVDATNTPARCLYENAGFHCYHSEEIYAWVYPRTG